MNNLPHNFYISYVQKQTSIIGYIQEHIKLSNLKNSKKEQYIITQNEINKSMIKFYKSSTATQAHNYITEHYNPKLLPALLIGIVNQSYYSQLSNGKIKNVQNQSKMSQWCNIILNNPNFCLLFSNMKLYNNLKIKRQNILLSQLQTLIQIKSVQKVGKIKLNLVNKKHITSCSQRLRIKRPVRVKTSYNQFKPGKNQIIQPHYQKFLPKNIAQSNEQNTKQKLQNKLKYVDLLDKCVTIYQYRITDLTLCINVIHSILKKIDNKNNQKLFMFVNIVLQKLEHLCHLIYTKNKNIKDLGDQFMKVFQECMRKQKQDYGKFDNNENIFMRTFAKQIRLKIKQINDRYTLIYRQMMKRHQKYRQIIQKQRNLKIKLLEDLLNEKMAIQDGIDEQQDSITSLQNSTNLNSQSGVNTKSASYRSILKNRLGMNGRDKRISIQIITSMLEAERKRKIKQNSQVSKYSKFRHREGLNIGSGRNLKGAKSKIKKQVKIQANHTNEDYDIQDHNKSSIQNGMSSQMSKNLEKFQMLKQMLFSKELTDCQQLSDYVKEGFKRYFSYQQIHQQISSKRSITSKSSRSRGYQKSKTSIVKRQCRKLGRKYTFCYGNTKKPFYSSKTIKTNKNIKNQPHITQSFKNIMADALQRKKSRNVQPRSGKFIDDDLSQLKDDQNPIHSYKKLRNKKIKQYNKDRSKFNKQKYNLLHQSLKNNEKQKSNDLKAKNKKNDQKRSTRRIGIQLTVRATNQVKPEIPTVTSPKQSSNKLKSQTISLSSSKKCPISSVKINNGHGDGRLPRNRTQTNDQVLAQTQFKVNFEQRFNVLESCVQFYNGVECTLHKLAKKHEKQALMNEPQQNKMLQLTPIYNYKVKKNVQNKNTDLEIKQKQMKLQMFQQQNYKLSFSRRLVTAVNQLKQTDFL